MSSDNSEELQIERNRARINAGIRSTTLEINNIKTQISGEEEIHHYPNYYNLHFDWQAICQYCIQKIREDSSRHLHSYPFLLSAQRYAHISIK